MSEFFKFLAAAGKWGVALMTGGLLSLSVALYEHFKGSSLGAAAFATVGVLAVLLGGFLAWKDEHKKLLREQEVLRESERRRPEAEDKSKPKLVADQLDQWAVSELPGNTTDTAITIWMHVKNWGAPSTVERFDLSVLLPDGRQFEGERQYAVAIEFAGKGRVYAEDCLFTKHASNPLVTGANVHGWLLFMLRGVTQAEVHQQTTLFTIRFRDVTGVEYKVQQTMTGTGPGNFSYFPGMRPPGPIEEKKWEQP